MMDFWNFLKCNIIQVFVGFVCFQLIACDCLFPDPDFPNGRIKYISPEDINKTHAEEMYVLQFICSPGYNRIGNKFIQCVEDEWSDEVPICAIMECPVPPNIQNAMHVLKSGVNNAPTLGSSAIYSCKAGYELNDTDTHTLRCVLGQNSRRAKWSGEMPICQEKNSCPDPGVSKHGSRRGKCCLSGNSLLFSCNDGYELVGKNMIQCLRSGEWSSGRPLCRPLEDHCELPPHIPHGVVIGVKEGDYFVPDEEAQILCEPGFTPKGPEFLLCDEEGVWDGEFEECTEIFCDTPPSVARGTIPELLTTNLTSFPYNFGITYICDEGYRLIDGDGWRMCGKRGWTGKTPSCEVIQCADTGTPENGKKIGEDYSVGSKVQFSCFAGYDLLGSIERFCLPNGQWTGELSRCDLPSNYCPNPGVPIKGSKNSSNYDLYAQIRFYCDPGYIQIGSEVRNCLEDHTWSGTETKCLGPYDFDNEAQVRDILQTELTQKAEEQKQELKNYRKALYGSFLNGSAPMGRMLDLNYPGRIILYFAFDVSGSIGSHNFAKSIQFAKAVVRKVGISENGARAGALTFSSDAEEMFLPLNFNTTEGVLDALDKIYYTGGGTAASSAFSMIRQDFMPLVDRHLGNKNIKSVIFLITDGKANMGGSPKEEAKILKKAGVEIYCIGITGDPRKKTLYDLASTSKSANGEHPNVYILQDYATFSWLIQEITNGTVDYSQCGLGLENVESNANRGRVVGGEKSKDPWPWMAALYMKSKPTGAEIFSNYELKCGGSVVHRHFILTAAHCMFVGMEQRNKKDIIIKLGLTDIQNQNYVQESEVLKIHIHPRYRPGPLYDYDIALLQMERPVEYNAFVRPVCLPPKELPENTLLYSPTALAWATGWGHDGVVQKDNDFIKHKVSQKLKEIPLPIQSRDRCQQSMKDNGLNVSYFTDHMFCAGNGRGGNDTCQGDSGGPLMQSLVNTEGYLYWTQVGIISWGIGCGLENTYGYYSHVQILRQWIDETIENATKKM